MYRVYSSYTGYTKNVKYILITYRQACVSAHNKQSATLALNETSSGPYSCVKQSTYMYHTGVQKIIIVIMWVELHLTMKDAYVMSEG